MAKKPPATPSTAEMLRNFRDRIVSLEQEKKTLFGDIKDIYQEAKNQGFDMKALRRVVKDSMMDQTQRAAQRETEEIADVYRASLGMLDGTPLGDSARRRYEEATNPPAPPEKNASAEEGDGSRPIDDHDEAHDPEATRSQGRADHAAGKSILQNPYEASDERRADWDEGWCEAAGSDGMDVPDAWRRRSAAGDQPGREA